MLFRNHYNNYCASDPYLYYIHKKLATDIHKSYSIALPHWTLRFVSKLFLAYLGYATHKNKGNVKGRQVNDPSDILLGTNKSGALNSHK